jgi:hypothetical protein
LLIWAARDPNTETDRKSFLKGAPPTDNKGLNRKVSMAPIFGTFMRHYAADIEDDARDMIWQYGDAAAQAARERAEIADKKLRNQPLAQAWRDIADVIERRSRKPRKP